MVRNGRSKLLPNEFDFDASWNFEFRSQLFSINRFDRQRTASFSSGTYAYTWYVGAGFVNLAMAGFTKPTPTGNGVSPIKYTNMSIQKGCRTTVVESPSRCIRFRLQDYPKIPDRTRRISLEKDAPISSKRVYNTGIIRSVSSVDTSKPPITAAAIGARHSAPLTSLKTPGAAVGNMPQTIAMVVIIIGRNRVGPAWSSASRRGIPLARNVLV
jgi:hypothetical protein